MSLWLEGLFLLEKTVFRTCFEASGLHNILYLYSHCNILGKSTLKDSDEELELQTTEKIAVSPAKSLTFEVSSSKLRIKRVLKLNLVEHQP